MSIKCSHCESTTEVHYHGIEGADKSVLAEGCEACGTYLKIFNMERDPHLEPERLGAGARAGGHREHHRQLYVQRVQLVHDHGQGSATVQSRLVYGKRSKQ